MNFKGGSKSHGSNYLLTYLLPMRFGPKGPFLTGVHFSWYTGNLTLFCYYYIPYFTHKSQINAYLSSRAKWARSDVTAPPVRRQYRPANIPSTFPGTDF